MQRRGSKLPQQQAAQRQPSLQLPTLDDIGALLEGLPGKVGTATVVAAEEVTPRSGSLGRSADPAAERLASGAHARQHSGALGTASPSKRPVSSARTEVHSTEARPEPSTAVHGQPSGHRQAGGHSSAVPDQAAGHAHTQRASLQDASNLGRNQALRAFIADGRRGHFAGAGERCAPLPLLPCCFCRQAGSPPSGLHSDQLPRVSKVLAAAATAAGQGTKHHAAGQGTKHHAAGQGTTHWRLGPLSLSPSCLQRVGRQHG